MNVILLPVAESDLLYWKRTSPQMIKRIKLLLKDCCEHPEYGIGKPERLRFELTGCWSRRIDREHRMLYKFDETNIEILSLRYHYK